CRRRPPALYFLVLLVDWVGKTVMNLNVICITSGMPGFLRIGLRRKQPGALGGFAFDAGPGKLAEAATASATWGVTVVQGGFARIVREFIKPGRLAGPVRWARPAVNAN